MELNNINYETESTDTGSDIERQKILFEILELNEAIDEIKTADEVQKLEDKLNKTMQPFKADLDAAFKENNFKLASEIVSKMKYYKNIYDRLQDLKLKFQIASD